tara:strand:- start:212 stop:415 length:204 start_codon:yes stop_codon:yes gene_type:complete
MAHILLALSNATKASSAVPNVMTDPIWASIADQIGREFFGVKGLESIFAKVGLWHKIPVFAEETSCP